MTSGHVTPGHVTPADLTPGETPADQTPGDHAGHQGRAGGHRLFDVVAVCTANLCRSPIMEAQLRACLAPLPGRFAVRSAGTEAREGLPAHPDSVRALAARDLALPADWVSHRLAAADLDRADLVLTATRAHRGQVLALEPRAAGRVFTLRQFGRLLAAGRDRGQPPDPGLHPGDLLLLAARDARGSAAPRRPEDDDLPDPIGRPYRFFRETATIVAAAGAAITAAAPTPPATVAGSR